MMQHLQADDRRTDLSPHRMPPLQKNNCKIDVAGFMAQPRDVNQANEANHNNCSPVKAMDWRNLCPGFFIDVESNMR